MLVSVLIEASGRAELTLSVSATPITTALQAGMHRKFTSSCSQPPSLKLRRIPSVSDPPPLMSQAPALDGAVFRRGSGFRLPLDASPASEAVTGSSPQRRLFGLSRGASNCLRAPGVVPAAVVRLAKLALLDEYRLIAIGRGA